MVIQVHMAGGAIGDDVGSLASLMMSSFKDGAKNSDVV